MDWHEKVEKRLQESEDRIEKLEDFVHGLIEGMREGLQEKLREAKPESFKS